MAKYLACYMGYGTPPEEFVQLAETDPEVSIIEKLGSNFVVEGNAKSVRLFFKHLLGWNRSIVRSVAVPDSKVKPKK